MMPHPSLDAGALPPAPLAARRPDGLRLIVAAGIAALLLFVAGLVAFHARAHLRRAHAAEIGLPGVTLDADAEAAPSGPTLVVTSLRSHGSAWRGGVRVGDRLEAIDGRPVPGRAALRRVLAAERAPAMVLHLRRGARMVDVRIDREPPDGTP